MDPSLKWSKHWDLVEKNWNRDNYKVRPFKKLHLHIGPVMYVIQIVVWTEDGWFTGISGRHGEFNSVGFYEGL